MNPRKARTLIPLVTKELDLEKQLVSDLVYFYWQKVRKALTNMSASRVRVENLGTFNLRVKKTQGLIKALQEEVITLRSDYKKLNDKFIETLQEINE